MKPRPTIHDIIAAVTMETGEDFGQLVGRRRDAEIVCARRVAVYLCRRMTFASYPEIAAAFDRVHHVGVFERHQRALELMGTDPAFAALVERCERRVRHPDPWKLLSNDEAASRNPERFRAEVAREAV